MRFRYVELEGPGPFGVPGFWFKKMTNLHGRLAKHLQACVNTSTVPTWMTKDRTVLIMKDSMKSRVASNYRGITCLFTHCVEIIDRNHWR